MFSVSAEIQNCSHLKKVMGGGEQRKKRGEKKITADDEKVGCGHERSGCHKIQLLSSLVTLSIGYKTTLSRFHTESLKLYF